MSKYYDETRDFQDWEKIDMDRKIQSLEAKLKVAVEALELYAHGEDAGFKYAAEALEKIRSKSCEED